MVKNLPANGGNTRDVGSIPGSGRSLGEGKWTQCRGIGPHLAGQGKSHGFSRVVAGTGGYSRVTAGMSIRNSSLFIEVRNLSRYEGQLRNVN